jgi:hypothetical protein
MAFETASFVGLGQSIEFSTLASPPVGYDLAHITDVTYSGSKVDTADTTDTTAVSGYRTFIPGLQDAGDCTVKMIWYPGETTQEAVFALKGSSATVVHTLPNSLGAITFVGLVVSFDHTAPLDKAGEATVKVKISGQPVYSES